MARKFWVNTDRNAAVTKAIKDIDKYSVSADDGSIAGGLIEGAGTGTSDSILAYLESTGHFVRLSDGEFVMTAEATKKNRPMLEAMNKGAFKNGGAIYAPSIPGGFSYTSAGNFCFTAEGRHYRQYHQ